MSYLKKNERYKTGCIGSLYFNPIKTEKTTLTFYSYSSTDGAMSIAVDNAIPETYANIGDLVLFGGQFVGIVEYIASAGTGYINIRISVPEETWDDMSSLLDGVLTKYVNNYDNLYIFRPNYDYSYTFNSGAGYNTSLTKYPDVCIENVRIKEYSENVQRKTFGFHRKQYDSLAEYSAILEVQPDADKLKIDQMLNSEAILFLSDDRNVEQLSLPTGWKYDKPKGGGSINPIGRKVSVKDGDIKYGLRRGYQLINVILEG
jgi:hypothetical protein